MIPRQPTANEIRRARERYRDGVSKSEIMRSLRVGRDLVNQLLSGVEPPEASFSGARGRKNGLSKALSRFSKARRISSKWDQSNYGH